MKRTTGTITSLIGDTTAIVRVERKFPHPTYQKLIRRSKKYHVHVPEGAKPKLGDIVEIKETKPISKNKKFILVTAPKPVTKKSVK